MVVVQGFRRASLVVVVLALTAVTAACGGTTSPSPGPTSSLGADASADPAPTLVSPPDATPALTPGAAGSTPAATPASGLLSATAPPLVCDGLAPTPAQAEGPYFTPGSPERADLREPGMAGTTLVVVGHVVDASCAPVAGAKVDAWQADAAGVYDNEGYRLRGHVFTAADGTFRLVTVVPGQYPGRTEHLHVKVTPPGGATLTTQLYFPGSGTNAGDRIYDPATLLAVTETPEGLIGTFDFVIPAR